MDFHGFGSSLQQCPEARCLCRTALLPPVKAPRHGTVLAARPAAARAFAQNLSVFSNPV